MRRRVRRATTPVTTMILISSLEDLAKYPYNTGEEGNGWFGFLAWKDSTQFRSSQSTLFG
jgi:hypothetical protein